MSEPVISQQPAFGTRSEVTGLVGTKGGVSLILDSNRPGFQMEGNDVPNLMEEFEVLESLLLEEFGFNSEDDSRFYEIDAQALVWSQASPIDVLRRHTSEISFIDDIADVTQLPIGGYGIKLTSKTGLPGDEEWVEFQIEPALRSPTSAYFVVTMCRLTTKKSAFDFAARIPTVFSQVAARLEVT